MKIIPALGLLLFPYIFFAQNVWRVNIISNAANPTGASWALAFNDLHQALAVAQNGDEVWIAKGTYKPSATDDRFKSFHLPSGVALYGGFNGTETQRAQRNWTTNPTVLSGDIGIPGDSTDNSFGVLYALNTSALTRVDGLVIEEGNANNPDINVIFIDPTRSGGGIYLDGDGAGNSAQLDVFNCTFRRNRTAHYGGGLLANGRDGGQAIVRLDNCLFEKNRAGYFGGGFLIENYTAQPFPVVVTNCTFRENYAFVEGAAAWLNVHQEVKFSDCVFEKNAQMGSGIVRIQGDNFSDPISFQRCDFRENSVSGDLGSAVTFRIFSTLKEIPIRFGQCNFYSNNGTPIFMWGSNKDYKLNVDNCVFHSNYESGASGVPGVLWWGSVSATSDAYLTNCLFYKNWKREFGGSFGSTMTNIYLKNSILIDNTLDLTPHIAGANIQVHLEDCIVSQVDCVILSQSPFNNVTCGDNVQFATDPLFVNPSFDADADFHLQPCSPALNAGDNAALDSLSLAADFEGNPRIRHGKVDIGPYEATLFSVAEIIEPSCHGKSDGSVEFGVNLCPPYTIAWSGNIAIGNTWVGNLPADTYIFTITDANGLVFTETVYVDESEPITIAVEVIEEILCYNSAGSFVIYPSGGTPPYNLQPGTTFIVPAGNYSIIVSDSKDCIGTETVILNEPPPLQIAYTVQNASGPNVPDGAIFIDSISGGMGAVTPPDLTGLLPGTYFVTVTDAAGCSIVEAIEVGFSIKTEEVAGDFPVRLFPNPSAASEAVFLEMPENELGKCVIFDVQGKFLKEIPLASGLSPLPNGFPPSIYRLEIFSESGKRAVLRWVVQ